MNPRLFDTGTDDVAVLAELHAACFPDAWGAAAIRELFAGPGVFAFLLPGGFILARAAGGEAEILTLAVAPSLRRQGFARALVQAAALHAQELGAGTLFLEVAVANDAACRLYQAFGFTAVGRRKAYYEGRDATILKASLPLPIPGDFA
jgi:[ribosomal protein S18]-alanine N-acetyltransferase